MYERKVLIEIFNWLVSYKLFPLMVHRTTTVLESLLNKVVDLEQPAQNSYFTNKSGRIQMLLQTPGNEGRENAMNLLKKHVKIWISTCNRKALKHLPGTISFETQVFVASIIGIQFSLLQDSIYVKIGSFNQLWAL